MSMLVSGILAVWSVAAIVLGVMHAQPAPITARLDAALVRARAGVALERTVSRRIVDRARATAADRALLHARAPTATPRSRTSSRTPMPSASRRSTSRPGIVRYANGATPSTRAATASPSRRTP